MQSNSSVGGTLVFMAIYPIHRLTFFLFLFLPLLLLLTCFSALTFRGDQTNAEAFLTVLPRGMECVVFSIDGSFAASVSIMGSDPKVRAGAVDVVR